MADLALTTRQPSELSRLPNFEPHDIASLELFAKIISNSELAPKDYRNKLENCMVAIMMGRELGLSPMQALQGIAVINGRPSVWGDALWALVLSHPEYGGCDEEVTEAEAKCVLRRIRRGVASSVTETFSMADAKKAGLVGEKDGEGKNTPWKTYPKRMMMWRARTFAARSLYADALKGLSSAEEVGDYIDGEQPRNVTRDLLSAEAATSAPAAPVKGEQAKPAETKVAEAETITAQQVKDFSAAYKASGWELQDARDFMSKVLDPPVNRSGAILASQWEQTMAWAKSPKPKPKPETKAAEPETKAEAEPS